MDGWVAWADGWMDGWLTEMALSDMSDKSLFSCEKWCRKKVRKASAEREMWIGERSTGAGWPPVGTDNRISIRVSVVHVVILYCVWFVRLQSVSSLSSWFRRV